MITPNNHHIVKDSIARHFSRSAKTYDANARIQEKSAHQLIGLIEQARTQIVPGPILEIGCGTGLVSVSLAEQFQDRFLSISDLSLTMVNYCRKKLKDHDQDLSSIDFSVQDGETLCAYDTYALIVSGLTFQWFLDIEQGLHRAITALKSGGTLFFSVLGKGSFPEWQAISKQLNIPFTGNPLPSISTLEKAIAGKNIKATFWKEVIEISYPTALDFFRNLKAVGTAARKHPISLKPHELRRLTTQWNAQHPEGIKISYEVIYACFRKN